MKLILTNVLLLFVFINHNAQTWVDFGVKGGFGANFLMNQNIWDDKDYNQHLTTGYSYGAKIGFNFNQEHEITFDAIFGKFSQKFNYAITDSANEVKENFNSLISFNKIDLALMYRRNKNGSYLEFGPCISLINSPKRTDSRTDAVIFNEAYINKINKGLILGFGNYILGTESFGITGGIRITHYLDNLISGEGITKNLPALKEYDEYKGSRPLFIELVFEANFDFAYVAKAKCGRKKLMFF